MVNKLWLLFAVFVITIAVLFTLLRIALPKIDVYKADIENWIEKQYEVDVEIAKISALWGTSGPVLSLNEFEIKSDDGQLDLLEASALEIEIDALSSILSGRLVTENINLRGLKANVLLDRQFAVRLDTIEEDEQSTAIPDIDETSRVVLENIFSQKKLVVLDSLISVETLTGKSFNYHITQLDIENFDEVHQFKGQLDDEFGGSFKLVAEMFGDPADDDSSTNLYLHGENLDLTKLPFYEKHPNLKPESGKFDWRVWSDWREGRWQTAVGDLSVSEIKWTSQQDKSSADLINNEFEKFSLNFSWKYNSPSTGELMFHNASLEADEQKSIEFSNVYLLYQLFENQDIQWQVISHDFQIAPLVDYFALPIFSQAQNNNSLVNADLSINLQSLILQIGKNKGVWEKPQFYTFFDQLSYDKLFDLPQLTNLSGEVSYVDNIGRLNVEAKNTEIALNSMFRDKLIFDSLNIDLNWLSDDKGQLDLLINSASFKNSDLSIAAKSRFFYQDDKPIFALFAEVSDVNLVHKSKYLPAGIMSESLVEFLDASVKNGRLSLAQSVVRGPLDSFPYEDQRGIFSVLGFVKNTEFKFLPDWPQVDDLSAKLKFEGNGMDLKALGGHSGLVTVNSARAVIKDFSAPNTPFELYIDANAKNNGGYEFLKSSALSDIAQSLEVLDFNGNAHTKIDMIFGLDDSSNLKLNGLVIPEKNKASVNVGGYQFDKINGEIKFDEKGIKQSEVAAFYFSEPVNATLIGKQNDSDPELTVNGQGLIGNAALEDLLGSKWAELSTGKSQINALVEISPVGDESAVHLSFESDLQGMAFALPGKLAKLNEDKTPLSLKVRLDEVSDVTLEWREFRGRWWWTFQKENYQHIGGTFLLNSEQKLPQKSVNHYAADIRLNEESLDDWLPIIDKIINQAKDSDVDFAEQGEDLFPSTKIGIHLDSLLNPLFDIQDLRLDLTKQKNQNWVMQATGPVGQIDLTLKDNAPWEINASKLNLNFTESFKSQFSDDEEESKETKSNEKILNGSEKLAADQSKLDNITNWPSIIIDCNDCMIQEFDIGTAKLSLLRDESELALAGNIVKGKNHNLNFQLNWSQLNKNTELGVSNNEVNLLKNFSEIEFALSSNNVGNLLRQLNYESGVKESRGGIVGKLSWHDTPWGFDVLKANGKANFDLGKGYLTEVSDAKARLFSLFSLQTLSRRLQLDFSDVFKKGFFYDRIRGDVSLEDQVLKSHNVFVDGNAAKVTIVGGINLADNSIEQHALVVPQLTSSLPVLVGWAVEPTTGILVFLLNKIFEPAIEVVTQIEYRVHGTLDEMAVDEVKKSKSKVKYDVPESEVTEEDLEPDSPARSEESTEPEVTSDS